MSQSNTETNARILLDISHSKIFGIKTFSDKLLFRFKSTNLIECLNHLYLTHEINSFQHVNVVHELVKFQDKIGGNINQVLFRKDVLTEQSEIDDVKRLTRNWHNALEVAQEIAIENRLK